jgi:glycosyltransferase involved in cell wall biosynthesis
MKTIFIIADFCANYPGNFVSSLLALEKRMADKWHFVYFFAQSGSEQFLSWYSKFAADHEAHLICFGRDGAAKVAGYVHRIQPDCLYFHFGGLSFPISVYRELDRGERRKTRLLYHLHSKPNDGIGVKDKAKLLISRLFCPRSLSFVASCEDFKQIVEKNFPRRKVYLSLNKIDFSRLQFNPGKRFEGSPKTALTFCYDYYIKGGDYAASIAKELHEAYNDFRLFMVVADHREAIEERLKNDFPDYKDYISILGPSSDISSIYALSNIYLLPSRTESLNYSVVEASYSGLTVVASDLPAIREIKLPRIKTFETGGGQ